MHIDDREKDFVSFQQRNCFLRAVFHDLVAPCLNKYLRLFLWQINTSCFLLLLRNLHASWRPRASGRCSLHLEPSRSRDSLMALELTPASYPHQDTKHKNNTNQKKPLLKTSSCHPLAKPVAVCTWWWQFHCQHSADGYWKYTQKL
jgi:hypothetical protein